MTALRSAERDGPGAWLWVVVLAGVVYVLKHGYAYGVGDHDETIPQLLRMLDPELYPRDWFVVEQGARFTVRTPFLWLLRGLCVVLPPWGAVLAVYVAGLVAVGAGVFTLGRDLGASRGASGLATVAALGVVPTWALSGSGLWFPSLAPEMLGWALALPALRLALARRFVWAGALLGLTAYLHLLVGFLTTAGVGLAVLLGGTGGTVRQRVAWTVRLGAAALVVALPMGLLILHDRATGPAVPAGGYSTWFLIVELRLPHHYLPSHYGVGAWARFGLLAALGVAGLGWLRARGRPLVFVERYALAVAVACGLAWALVEGAQSLLVAQLQVFKLTVPLVPLFALAAAEALVSAAPTPWARALELPFRRPRVGWSGAVGAGILGALLLAGPMAPRLDAVARRATDAAVIERWARRATPTDALFAVPPSNTSFRTGARRSVVITFKPTSFQEGSTHVWYDRLVAVAPGADPPPVLGLAYASALDNAYAQNGRGDWQGIADTFGAEFALVDRTRTPTPPAGAPLVEQGSWAVYALPPPRIAPAGSPGSVTP